MNIKDFVEESLRQIVDSITDVNKTLEEKGAMIVTKGIVGEGVWVTRDTKQNQIPTSNGLCTKHIMRINFDLAVTVTNSGNSNFGGGITVASIFNAKTSKKQSNQNQSVSRIQFTIPLEMPELKKDNS